MSVPTRNEMRSGGSTRWRNCEKIRGNAVKALPVVAMISTLALMAGARAVMAVMPQMLVPAAINDDIFAGSPMRLPSHGTILC